ncbi:MAG: hypothetical protein ACJASV_000596 [Pseudorhodobacter sp.]|jgi:hypothetical protein
MSGTGQYFRHFLARTDERVLVKMDHYMDVYDDILAPWAGRTVSFLEIGVYLGGSLRMWRDFFSPMSQLTFLDIDPACKLLELAGTTVEIGDQTDTVFLGKTADEYGPFDIIVDDGGHKMNQQIISFQALWPRLNDGGLYIVEDTHTSYWPGFGGGLRAPGSFIEFSKALIDLMHSWYTEDDAGFPLHPLAAEIGSIRYYDSLVVIEKKLKQPPKSISSKNGVISEYENMLKQRGRRSIF